MYVKLFQQILGSSIADDRRLRHFFTDLLLCADGKGYVMFTEQHIARMINASLEEVEWGLAELQKPDPKSKTKDHGGRRIAPVKEAGYGWKILNYEHYRSMKDADQLRESVRQRVQRHRSRKKGNADETDGNACNAIQKQIAEGKEEGEAFKPVLSVYSIAFLAFWKAYPKKEAKGDAWKAWQQVRAEALLTSVLDAIERHKKREQWRRDGGQFIPLPATWLRDKRWEDEAQDSLPPAKSPDLFPRTTPSRSCL
jgi:hypothetical protein